MKPRHAFTAVLAAIFALFIVIPACVSLASGDGQVCIGSGTCPLSAVNPCQRKPAFAIVGRCAVAIH